MQFDWQTHFDRVVIPSWRAFIAAEDRLSAAVVAQDVAQIDHESYEALREGGAAAIYLHHFTDIVWDRQANFLAAGLNGIDDTRRWLATMCYAGRSNVLVDDVNLLRDIADALKHATLTRQNPLPRVPANNRVITVGTGYGVLPFGEGKYGGSDQVVVLGNDRARALSGVLQNVIDAWRLAMGVPLGQLPPVGA